MDILTFMEKPTGIVSEQVSVSLERDDLICFASVGSHTGFPYIARFDRLDTRPEVIRNVTRTRAYFNDVIMLKPSCDYKGVQVPVFDLSPKWVNWSGSYDIDYFAYLESGRDNIDGKLASLGDDYKQHRTWAMDLQSDHLGLPFEHIDLAVIQFRKDVFVLDRQYSGDDLFRKYNGVARRTSDETRTHIFRANFH